MPILQYVPNGWDERLSMKRYSAKALFSLWALSLPFATSIAAAQAPPQNSAAAAAQIADFFGKVGDQIYQDCIFDLSEEQVEVQTALIEAYVAQGASPKAARKLAVRQIQPPKLSADCKRIAALPKQLRTPEPAPDIPAPTRKPQTDVLPWAAETDVARPPAQSRPQPAPPRTTGKGTSLANMRVPERWDCAPGVDFVTINRNGYQRKLTGGEICNPFKDIVRPVPDTLQTFRLGYSITTGRLFIDDANAGWQTIAWAISGREVCRNNPDPECIAAKGIGPLPPGEYSFSSDPKHRVSYGPITKRMVAGIYLGKLYNKDYFSKRQLAAVRKRGNIAIHVRLKGEMSEACLGLEPKGWAYISKLIKAGRTTGVNVYIDEPYPQVAEAPPVIVASTFSLTSLFD